MVFIQCVEGDQAVVLPGGFVGVGAQSGEHAAIFHAVTEQGDVVAGFVDVSSFPGVDGTPFAGFLVEVPLQVEVGLIRGLHHRVIDLGALHLDPAHGIVVLIVNLFITGDHHRFPGLRGGGSGFLCGGGGGRCGGSGSGTCGNAGKLVIAVGLLLSLDYISENEESADSENNQ